MIDVRTQESQLLLLPDLCHVIPLIVAEFNLASHTELSVFEFTDLPMSYMNTDLRDRVIKTTGTISGVPFVQSKGSQSKGVIGQGITYLRPRDNQGPDYAIFNCYTVQHWDTRYIFVPKKDTFRFLRHVSRTSKLTCVENEMPILADGLLDEIVKNTVGFLLKSESIKRMGVRIRRGIILDGPPGNGKTMACRYIQKLCTQRGIRWGVITSSDIDAAYNNQSLSELMTKHTVSFFDDIDIGYMDRTKGNGKIACSLLTALDGMESTGHLVRIFTTNEKVKSLDKAFTRPGRIDRCITFEKPDASLRRKLVETWPQEVLSNHNISDIVDKTNGCSFAELESVRTSIVTDLFLGNGKMTIDEAIDKLLFTCETNRSVGF